MMKFADMTRSVYYKASAVFINYYYAKTLSTITHTTARPGIIIGKAGQEVDKLKEELRNITAKEIHLTFFEIKRPELDAQLVGASVARQIESRISCQTCDQNGYCRCNQNEC